MITGEPGHSPGRRSVPGCPAPITGRWPGPRRVEPSRAADRGPPRSEPGRGSRAPEPAPGQRLPRGL